MQALYTSVPFSGEATQNPSPKEPKILRGPRYLHTGPREKNRLLARLGQMAILVAPEPQEDFCLISPFRSPKSTEPLPWPLKTSPLKGGSVCQPLPV